MLLSDVPRGFSILHCMKKCYGLHHIQMVMLRAIYLFIFILPDVYVGFSLFFLGNLAKGAWTHETLAKVKEGEKPNLRLQEEKPSDRT